MNNLRTVTNADGAAVLDITNGTISTMNTTGAYVWRALERGESPDGIIDALVRETGEARHRVEQDVRAFLANLKEQNLWSL